MKEGIIIREKCPVCHSITSSSIFIKNFDDELIKEYMNIAYQGNADIDFLENVKFEIVKCKVCKIAYQKYVLDERRLNDLYNKWINPKLAQEWNENGDKTEQQRVYTYILNYVKDYLKRDPNKIKVLDYGAGFGDSLKIANVMGFDTFAYEYSLERIHLLKEKGIKTIDNTNEILFDFIIVNQILEHITYPGEVLKIISSMLNKNGLVFVAVPNCSQLKSKLAKTTKIKDANELHQAFLNSSVGAFQHINFFTNRNLKLLLLKNDFKLLNPLKQALNNPYSIKSFLRPYYRHFFGTSLFVVKV